MFVHWLTPLLRCHFYVTDSELSARRVVYFRHRVTLLGLSGAQRASERTHARANEPCHATHATHAA